MKKVFIGVLFIIAVMALLPAGVFIFAPDRAGMLLCLTLLFALHPVFSVFIGIFAGKEIKTMWFFPLLISLAFISSTWLTLTLELTFLLYGAAYGFLCAVSMGVTHLILQRKTK